MQAAYLRYSPKPEGKSEDNDTNSLEVQRARITEYWNRFHTGLSLDWIEDPMTSARLMALYERRGGKELRTVIHNYNCRDVYVASLDRLFRDVCDGLTVLNEWKQLGVRLHCCDGLSVDMASAHGVFITTMLLATAALEPMRTAERTSASHRVAQDNGKIVSRYLPWGKMLDPDRPGYMIDDVLELRIKDELTRLTIEGRLAPTQIADHMNKTFPSPARYHDGWQWTGRRVSKFQQRYIYKK